MKFPTVLIALGYTQAFGTINSPQPRLQSSMKTAGWCKGDNSDHIEIQSGTCFWWNQGCQAGCHHCNPDCGVGERCCLLPNEPTLNDTYRTYAKLGYHLDFTRHNPWRSPGHAPVIDPCGIAGGSFEHGPDGPHVSSRRPITDAGAYGKPPPHHERPRKPKGVEQGFRGLELPSIPGAITKWSPGQEVEVSWSMYENHGGGYQYRLCKKVGSVQYITEECFQQTPLKFTNDTQWLQWGTNVSTRTAIPATIVTEGVHPPHSTWMRNPIPACSGIDGGGSRSGCDGPQFEPPLVKRADGKEWPAGHVGIFKREVPGLYGYGLGACDSGEPGSDCTQEEFAFYADMFNFNIIDKIMIPTDLERGDYLLSFRWDVEKTPAVWSGCSDVRIE